MARRPGAFIVRAVLSATMLVAATVPLRAQSGVYNVELSRVEFYRLLDARERYLMEGLEYNPDFSVRRDTPAYRAALEEFTQYEENLRRDFMSRRGRDDALAEIFEEAEFDPEQRRKLFSDSGSAPGERLSGPDGRNSVSPAPITPQDTQTPGRNVPTVPRESVPSNAIERGDKDFYRGELGDRDITAKSPEDVELIKEKARKMGYTVDDRGDGYIKIKELDTIVWQEDSDAYRRYLDDPHGFKSRLENHEYVAGGKDSGAIQQVSKVQDQFRGGQPPAANLGRDRLSLERARYAQNLGKAGHKIDSTIVQRGQPTVTDPETRDRFRRLAQGQDQRVVLGTFGEKHPSHINKELIKLRDVDVVQTLKGSIDADRAARNYQRETLRVRNRELAAGITEATANGNVMDQRFREAELAENNRRIAQLDDIDRVEVMTRDVLVEKNPQIRRKIFDMEDRFRSEGGPGPGSPDVDTSRGVRSPDADSGAAGTRTTTKSNGRLSGAKSLATKYGAGAFGGAMSFYSRYAEEFHRSRREGQPMSQARLAVLVAADLTDVTDMYDGLTGLADETTTGTSDYIKSELDRFKASGVDTSKFSLRAALALKASIRGTVLGTWQGCKALPGVNMGIGAAEGIYQIGSAGSDTAREMENTAFIEEFNRITRSDNRDIALANAKKMATRIRTLHASHQKFDGVLRNIDIELSGMLEKLEPISEPLKQREEYVWNVVEAARKLHANGNFSHEALFNRLDASVTRFNTISKQADETRGKVEAGTAEMSSARVVYEGLNQDFGIESSNHSDTVSAAQGVMRLGEGLRETGTMGILLESLRNDMSVIDQADSAAADMLRSYRQALQYLSKVQPALLTAQTSLDRALTFFRNEAIRSEDSGMSRQLSGLRTVLEDTQIDTGRVAYYSGRMNALMTEVAQIGHINRDMKVPPDSGFEKFDLYAELANEAVTPLQQSIVSAGQARESALEALKSLRESLQAMPTSVVVDSKPNAPPPGSYLLSTSINRRRVELRSEAEQWEHLQNGVWGNDGYVNITFNNKTGEALGNLSYQKAAVMGRVEDGDLVWACANVFLKGSGRVDLKNGKFELALRPHELSAIGPVTTEPGGRPRGTLMVSADEKHFFPIPGSGPVSVWNDRTGSRVAAVKTLGIDPKTITARVTGQIDPSRGGGTARVQLGSISIENWTTKPYGSVGLTWPVHPRSYEALRKLHVVHVSLTLWPSVRSATDAAREYGMTDSLNIGERECDFQKGSNLRWMRLRIGRVIVMARFQLPQREVNSAAGVVFAPYIKGLREMGLDNE